MAWPYDAVLKSFSALVAVPSSVLNAIQERIVDLHSDRSIVLPSMESHVDGSGVDHAWSKNSGGSGFTCLAGGYGLAIRGQLPSAAVIKEIYVKWYLDSGAGMTIDPYADDHNFAATSTAPSSGALGSQATPSLGGYPGWGVSSWTGLSYTFDADTGLRIVIGDPDAGDQIAGVKIVYQPLTASS